MRREFAEYWQGLECRRLLSFVLETAGGCVDEHT